MPLSPAQDDYRNQIADALMPSRADKTPLAQGMAALPQNMMQQFTPQSMAAPPGMPTTPAGGVPGSGLAPAGPSTVQLPQQRGGLRGPMQGMSMGGMPPGGGGVPMQPMPMAPAGMPAPPQGVDQFGMMPGMRGGRRGY